MRKFLQLVSVLLTSAAAVPLLGRLDTVVSCPPVLSETAVGIGLSTLLAVAGAGTSTALTHSGRSPADTRADEPVVRLVAATLVFLCTAFWPWAFAEHDFTSVEEGTRCLPLPLLAVLFWALACAPSAAPLLDAVLGIVRWRRRARTLLPWFSLGTAALLCAVSAGLVVHGLLG